MTERSLPPFDYSAQPNAGRMPHWIRQSLSGGPSFSTTAQLVHQQQLHTVCEEARCPNRGECWSRGTATFMLLGDTCTRACGFCAVKTGRPGEPDRQEPERVAAAVERLGLRYVVLTSVNRDDLADGGASIYAATVAQLRRRLPELGIELLTPDFRECQDSAVEVIHVAAEGAPLVWGHNLETVPRLYQVARKGSKYERSLRLLALAAERREVEAKSALMLGLGERFEEVVAVMKDLRSAGVARIALGQYLRPTRHHLPVAEYISPDTFAAYAVEAERLGFGWVKAGPMVRSSYHAEEPAPSAPTIQE